MTSRVTRVGALVAGIVLAYSTAAAASVFTVTATGAASAETSRLPMGKRPDVVDLGNQTVDVRWPVIRFASGDDVPGYELTRLSPDGTTAVVCDIASPEDHCIDTPPAGLAVSYRVAAVAELWRGTPSAVSHAVIVAPPPG